MKSTTGLFFSLELHAKFQKDEDTGSAQTTRKEAS